MIKILLDPGHGAGSAHNRGYIGGNEGDSNWDFHVKLRRELEKYSIKVGTTRPRKTDNPSLSARGKMGKGYDLFLSIHSNAAGSTATGSEVFDDTNPKYSNKKLASALTATCSSVLGIPNRGVKYKRRANGSNWYGVLYSNAAKNGMLLEMFFHTNRNDVAKFKAKQDELARELARAIAKHYGIQASENPGVKPITPATSTPILATPTVTVAQMKEWAKKKNAHPKFVELANIYFNVSIKYGVDPAVTYAQSGKETGYFNFGGVLDITYHNPCGLKTSKGGGDKDPHAHMRFKNWEEGITAQVQHLRLYAGYATPNAIDPRHFLSIKGKAKTVEELGGNWAPSKTYGQEVADLVRQLSVKGGKKMDNILYITYKNDGDIPTAYAVQNAVSNAYLIKPHQVKDGMNVFVVGGQGKNRAETLKICVKELLK
ncbi:MAG: N-acetylmuramoyl-L-alanine amidase [Tissierellia bacterium]|nr:N-acetylmuramoyl-L-alanine amidase [Tissierellia bacterium]